MRHRYVISKKALDDIKRLFSFLEERDQQSAHRARTAIEEALEFMQEYPWACRQASNIDPNLRELVISFGHSGFVCLFRIKDGGMIRVLHIRHQLEGGYH